MNEVVFGDCRTSMIDMIDRGDRVQMCVTSPPYFGLRDYGHPGQLGLEQTPAEYVANMVEVFSLVWYLLADDGVLWLNLGDSYSGSGPSGASYQSKTTREREGKTSDGAFRISKTLSERGLTYAEKKPIPPAGLKNKDLIGIPWRVAFALQAAGWYLRQDIIWHKPNPMPESVTDRCTKAHEYLFLLSKSERYYFDNEAIKEPLGTVGNAQSRGPKDTPGRGPRDGGNGGLSRMAAKMRAGEVETRNRRSVWTIATKPYKGAHFATFPPALIEPCILAGTSQEGHCPKCGKRWERIVKRTAENHIARQDRQVATGGAITGGVGKNFPDVRTESIGFFPSCTCGAAPVPDVVFDPFMGSGTTAQVALQHGRRYLGCELNPDYEQLQKQRILA